MGTYDGIERGRSPFVPELGWIKCSERLPDEDGVYFVQREPKDGWQSMTPFTAREYRGGKWETKQTVVRWMRIPPIND